MPLFDSVTAANEILAAVRANGTAIEKVNTSVEKLHAAVFELQVENEKK